MSKDEDNPTVVLRPCGARYWCLRWSPCLTRQDSAVFLVTSRPRPGKNLLLLSRLPCTGISGSSWVPLAVLYFVPTLGTLLQRYAAPPAADSGSTLQPDSAGARRFVTLDCCCGWPCVYVCVGRHQTRRRLMPTQRPTAKVPPKRPNPTRFRRRYHGCQRSKRAPRFAAAIRRSVGRVYGAWKEGSVWISLFMGLTYSPLQATAALAVIATSGAPILAQLSAAVSFVAIMLAVVELILLISDLPRQDRGGPAVGTRLDRSSQP